MSPQIMVVLASNNSHLLDQGRKALAAERAIRIVGEAQKRDLALHMVRHRRPTILIIDLALPPAGGFLVLPQIKRRSPKTRVLAIDDRLDEARVLRAAKAGADGYMLQEAVPGFLAKAVRVMSAGEAWLSRSLIGKVVAELQRLARLQERGRARSTLRRATS
jgi:DNA-binding NarL/FixJ family response regulator